ncbi:MDR family MFS transporter [Ligilactobacillus ceti]|uniref:MFS family major facilitator transporter, multidrug cation symporter n=1 Tax=Ligilactobacillus ceti DSM 22408 TaxID=1122146 RepID=A0A0R2KSK2_9LACO|nr:MDR family MFS transporter [Ligilactobacillus ceti]KRN89287.1 MFS family major facilitator transporter, multidrug cation symporter [Ligilactobacillus ceti DSM 22408]
MSNTTTITKDIHGKPYKRALLVLVLVIGSFCTVLNATLLATAFPAIMQSFDVDTATVQWLTTGFMLVTGVMIPVSAWLINTFSSRFIYLLAMTVFLIGTTLCFIAPSFNYLLVGRLVQGFGVGITMPLLQTIMLTIFPPEQRGAAMGTVGLVIGLAPALGPTLSGFIVDTWTWRDLFGMIIPICVVVLILAFFFMKSVIPHKEQKIDIWSIITSTIGFGSLLYGTSSAGNKGWTNPYVLAFIIVGVIFVALFSHRQLQMSDPFLDISVFKYREFRLASVLSAISNLAMVGAEMILPLYIQTIRGESAFHSGLMLLPGALVVGFMSPITGRLFDRYGAKMLAITGMTLLSLATVPFLFLTPHTSIVLIIGFYMIRMFGIGMVMMTVTTSGMNVLPLDKLPHGTAVNNTFRQVLSSIGTAILISILTTVTTNHLPAKSLLKTTPLAYKQLATDAVLNGYKAAFLMSILFALCSLTLAFFLKKGNIIRKLPVGGAAK